ncbi:hypothetical protein C8C83_5422 [Flavobacterium sp. 90]|uniref:hypothetical protein n=1 Tax=unclassified Flavobacterium TaxID=196869 RepID=UPI000EAE6D0B|nr:MULTISPECIES: hypothetical protein [unclassified Flavobacterium]RKR08187.1 hypothetical protein C8C82_0049 [Flavobacterium sp. 81]TCK57378.1 hypothetical protein C8C83_5422 [Flavobacterium sp. 90]
MDIISDVEVKVELDNIAGKFPAFSGKNYPLEYLGAREFELLSYFIFKKDIENGIYKNKIDSVLLMKGGSDRGRDLLLQFKSKNVGILQCKRYEGLITKPGLGREIIKFAIHAIKDKSLITDLEDFTYYFVALKGFNEPATKFLTDYNKDAIDEVLLKPWTEEVLADNESLKHLKYENIFDDLISILSKIKIEPITGHDLDQKLKNSKDILAMFFEVEKVASEDMLRTVLAEFTGFKNDQDLEKLRVKLQHIPKEKRMYFGLFDVYGYDLGFYKRITRDAELINKLTVIRSEFSKHFVEYLGEEINKYILLFISGKTDVSPFTKSILNPYLFNKFAAIYSRSELGFLKDLLTEGAVADLKESIEDHKNDALKIGQMVLNGDYSSFYGEGGTVGNENKFS